MAAREVRLAVPARKAECPFVKGERASLSHGEVNYQLQGPPAPAPLLVCVHGLNGSISSFKKLEPRLRAAGLRVLLFDLYGFGLSSSARVRYNESTYVEQLSELLDELHVSEQIMLLGYSMGGIVATEFARQHPERVARVLLIAPGGLLAKSETPCAPLLFGCLRTRLGCCLVNLAACVGRCCSCPLRRALKPGMFHLDVREPEQFQDVSLENFERFRWNIKRSVTSYLRALKSMPLWSEDFRSSYAGLASSKLPVLFIWGDDDNTVPWSEVGEEVVELFEPKGTSCIRLKGAGHGLLIEDAEVISNYAVAWFSNSSDPGWQQLLEQSVLNAAALRTSSTSVSLPTPTPAVMGNAL